MARRVDLSRWLAAWPNVKIPVIGHEIRTLRTPFGEHTRVRLREILLACVADGASVGFLEPLDGAQAEAYWHEVETAVSNGLCVLFANADLTGTVQLDLDTMGNQPHRATVSKLLVDPSARRQGLGVALMRALEERARADGRWLLTLDTATDAADRLYRGLGWSAAGAIPDYAMNPDASLTETRLYYKRLR
jgi:ribosomal protein S18 acetylase RimI-like enzyme